MAAMTVLTHALVVGNIIDKIIDRWGPKPSEYCPEYNTERCISDPRTCMFNEEEKCVAHRCYALNDTACADDAMCTQRRWLGNNFCGPTQKYAMCSFPKSECGESERSRHCHWNETNSTCEMRDIRGKCGAQTRGSCFQQTECDWHNVQERCDVRSCGVAEDGTHCQNLGQCFWTNTMTACSARIDSLTTACSALPRKYCGHGPLPCAEGSDGRCNSCADLGLNPTACNAQPGCRHIDRSRYGTRQCVALKDYCDMQRSTQCQTEHCLYITSDVTGSILTIPHCKSTMDIGGCASANPATCLATPMCDMVEGKCTYANVTCAELSPQHCISYKQCGLDVLTGDCLPRDVCTSLREDECGLEQECTWFPNAARCRRVNLKCNADNKLECNMRMRCGWHSKHGCVPVSGCTHLEKDMCGVVDAGTHCKWDDVGGCMPMGTPCDKLDLSENAPTCGGLKCDHIRSTWRGELTVEGHGFFDGEWGMDLTTGLFMKGPDGRHLCPANKGASCLACEAGYTINPYVRVICGFGGQASLSGQFCIKLGDECTKPLSQCGFRGAPEGAAAIAPSLIVGALVLLVGLL